MAMPTATTPLLAPARASNESQRPDSLAEKGHEALAVSRGAQGRGGGGQRWTPRLRELVLFAWALAASAVVIVLAVSLQHERLGGGRSPEAPEAATPRNKRNLIFMVSDGMGPASLALTRSFRQRVDGRPINDTLALDRHFWGTSRTRSSNSLVTDSAAGATAFSCGRKSYNGAISILPDLTPCGTVLEAAKRAGYLTGLVVTTDITDATPACFASHVANRMQMDEIALHEIGNGPLGHVVDLMLGGGRCHFLANTSADSCRQDAIDVAGLAQAKGWTYLDSRAGFDSLQLGRNVTLPTLGLFARNDIPFELDRRAMAQTYPSLSEMATAALRALETATHDSDKGFFLMIEGSRIDHAGHFNDPAAQVHEVLEYDKTFQVVLDFLAQSDADGVVVSTSDHETGGLATAFQEPGHLPVYNWYPTVLARAKASAEQLARLLRDRVAARAGQALSDGDLRDWINTSLLVERLGVTDAREEEIDQIVANAGDATVIFSAIISRRAHIGWSTHGHSAVDVNVYSSGGAAAEAIRGNRENTDIGKFLRHYLAVDVDDITAELREKMSPGRRTPAAASGPPEAADYEMEGLKPEWAGVKSPRP